MDTPTILQTDYDISFLSAFKTRALARYFFDVREHTDIEKLKEIYDFARENSLPVVIIG